jgi:hypothetical protein
LYLINIFKNESILKEINDKKKANLLINLSKKLTKSTEIYSDSISGYIFNEKINSIEILD